MKGKACRSLINTDFCTRTHLYVTRMVLVSYSYARVCTRMYTYALACTRTHLYVTRMVLVSYSYVLICTRMNSLVCYTYVVLVTIVRQSMLIKLPVYIYYWKSADLVALNENCLHAQTQREEKLRISNG